jgi:hypothetical protein
MSFPESNKLRRRKEMNETNSQTTGTDAGAAQAVPAEPTAPVGSVTAYAGPTSALPPNWLVCVGRRLETATYRVLFQRIGTTWGGDGVKYFHLPDLRGQFLRGVDRAQDGTETPDFRDPERERRTGFVPPDSPSNPGNSGNAVGSFQRFATARPGTPFITNDSGAHSHGDPTWNGQPGPYELATTFRGPGGYDYGEQSAPTKANGNHQHMIVQGGDSETRPNNAYVYWIIRAK